VDLIEVLTPATGADGLSPACGEGGFSTEIGAAAGGAVSSACWTGGRLITNGALA